MRDAFWLVEEESASRPVRSRMTLKRRIAMLACIESTEPSCSVRVKVRAYQIKSNQIKLPLRCSRH